MISKVVYSDRWLDFWGFGLKDISGMTIFPFIILREKDRLNPPLETIRHEEIHIVQQAESLLIFFALIYYFHWLINIIKYKIKREPNFTYKAYRDIIFEKEAYENSENPDYLNNRKVFACFRKQK